VEADGRATGDEVEAALAELIRSGAFEEAVTSTLEHYGPELYGFLVHLLGDDAAASEVFSEVSERIWRGIPGFGFRSSLRTWLYVLARHAAANFVRSPWNRGELRTSDSRLESLRARARSRTQPWLRTDLKDRLQELRESLDPEDRALLVLRVDRQLPWRDVARISLGLEEPDADSLAREAARLRKRFQLLREELHQRARDAGLLDEA
jgi:RNA polymerase sigma-70 factor (ECF subfamily)